MSWRGPSPGDSGNADAGSEGAQEAQKVAVEALAAEDVMDGISPEKLVECEEDVREVEGLNASQQRAVRAALTRRCTVIQGPPGTGKTTASVHILRLWAKLGLGPILATADGNVAVDNIVLGLVKLGVNVVRVGSSSKISASLEEHTLDYKVALLRGERAIQCEETRQRLEQQAAAQEATRAALFREALQSRTVEELRATLSAGQADGGPLRFSGMNGGPQRYSTGTDMDGWDMDCRGNGPPPRALTFKGCCFCGICSKPELCGEFVLCDASGAGGKHEFGGRPVYCRDAGAGAGEEGQGEEAAGSGQNTLEAPPMDADEGLAGAGKLGRVFCFFAGKRSGWVMSHKLGNTKQLLPPTGGKKPGVAELGGELLAMNPKKGRLPPGHGWMVRGGGGFQAHSGVLWKVVAREELVEALC